ncbi:MAG TPA: VTT domain-containing protein [Rhodanobacteraceae bacterium]|nr:VTT domain-containing protein [Rhodanobacteraceae bacterium]
MKRLRAALPLIVLVATGIALFASGALNNLSPEQLANSHSQLQESIAHYPWFSRLAYVGLLALVVATGIPASVVITVAAGLLFGILQATALSTVGVLLGSWLLFFATRMALGKERHKAPALVERLRHGYAHHPGNYTLFLRLAPGLPWGGVTVALAWLRCPLKLFSAATATGALVMSVIESAIGTGIGEGLARGQHHFDLTAMLFNPYILISLGGLAVLALVPLLFGHLHRPPDPPSPPPP